MTILGIDPGSTRVGYGAIKCEHGELLYISSGILSIPRDTKPNQLVSLETALSKLIAGLNPDRVVIERLFVTRNQKTAIEVAQARGVIVATIAKHRLPLVELTPSEIKLAVAGDGRASKGGVSLMVTRLLSLPKARVLDDITDALAAAIAGSGRLAETR